MIDVTDRGRPVARIVPLQDAPLDQLVTEGRASAPEADLVELLGSLSLPAASKGSSPTHALQKLREDER